MDRDFKGVWIPKEFYLNKDLSWAEKILLVEIDSLDKDGIGCFASNEYLANFLMLSEGSVANMIIKLINKGYLIKKGFDGRKRYISVNSELTKILSQDSQKDEVRINKNMNSESTKTLTQSKQKYEHSNTINKTITKPLNKTIKKESKKNFTLLFPSEFSPQLIKKVTDFIEYRKEIKKPFKSEKSITQKIENFAKELKQYGEEIVIASIDNAIANGWQGTFINKELLNNQKQNQNGIRTQQSEQEIRLRSSANIAQGFLNQIHEEERRRNDLDQYLSQLEKSNRR